MEIALGLLSVMIAFVVLGTVMVWPAIVRRWRRGDEIVEHEPRRPVTWGLLEVVLVASGYLVSQVMIAQLLEVDHDQIGDMLRSVTLSNLAAAVWVVMLVTVGGGRSHDLGLSLQSTRRDVWIGLCAFAAIAPLIYAVQALLSLWFEGKHPVVELLQSVRDPWTLASTFVGVVIVAPIVEELLFRVVLQGWLERLMNDLPRGNHQIATVEGDVDSIGEPQPTTTRSWPAIMASSAIFAAMHYRDGSADPVPLFFLAVVLGYLYQQTHRIWPSIALHAALNGTSLLALLATPAGVK
jgi:membrane protease YdiL (CAAX protease family)